MPESKICSKCGESKPATLEYFRMGKKSLRSDCRACEIKRRVELYRKNPEKTAENMRKWREKNPERSRELVKEYQERNHDKYKESRKKWRTKTAEVRNAYARHFYHQNDESRKRKLVKGNKYTKFRLDNDPTYKILRYTRNRVYIAIRKGYKSASTLELLGCTPEYAKKHLEGKFLPGMSWDNYGEWHIDHIKPLASFDLTNPEEQRKAFHYTNIQPLWAEDNLKKGAKILTDTE